MTEHMNNSELISRLDAAEKRIAELEHDLAHKAPLSSERQEREQVEAAELRYRALFEQSHDAIFIFNLEGRNLDVNQRATDMLGYSRDELLQFSAQELSAEPAKSHKVWQGLLNGERMPVYERSLRRKDGSNILVEINVKLIHNAQGMPLHIQFFEDGFQMPFHGVGGDDQFLGDFLIGQALSQQIEDFAFAVGERAQLAHGLVHGLGLFHRAAERGTVESLLLDVSRDRVFRIYPLDFLGLSDTADYNRGNAVCLCGSE